MNCPRCGMTVQPHFKFCPNCQQTLQGQPRPAGSGQAQAYKDIPQQNAVSSPSSPFPQAHPVTPALRPILQAHPAPPPSHPSPGVQANAAPDAQPPATPLPSSPPQSGPYRPPVSSAPETPRSTSAEETLVGSKGKEEQGKEGKEEEEEENENERLLIFSDAIIAFAITIAAVPLRVPKDLDTLAPDFWFALVSYIFGFFLVYSLWRDHHSVFQHLKRNNTWLVALNTVFLALVVFIPVGFIITLSVVLGTPSSSIDQQVLTVVKGLSISLGTPIVSSAILLLIWISARMRPLRLFGAQAPEKPFVIYMTRRLMMRVISIAAYITIFFMLLFGSAYESKTLLYGALGVFVALLLLQILVLSLYRRHHKDVLHRYLGREETARLQLFSDAIFAVAITVTIAQMDPIAEASELWSLVGTFLFSLLFLVVFWLLHYHLFQNVRYLNRTLIGLNFLFLLLVILDFLPSRLYSPHMGDRRYSIFFSIYQLVIAGCLLLMWIYVRRHKPRQEPEPSLIKPGLSQRRTRRLSWVLAANPLNFGLLAIAAGFKPIDTYYYTGAYLALLGLTLLIGTLTTRRLPAQKEVEAVVARA